MTPTTVSDNTETHR